MPKNKLLESILTIIINCILLSSAQVSAQATVVTDAPGEEGSQTAKTLTFANLPPEVLRLIAAELSQVPTQRSIVDSSAAAAAAGGAEAKNPTVLMSDWLAFASISRACQKAALSVKYLPIIPVTSTHKLMHIVNAPDILKTFQLTDLVVNSFPVICLNEDETPAQTLRGSLVVLGTQENIEATRLEAAKHPDLKVRYVVNDMEQSDDNNAGADADDNNASAAAAAPAGTISALEDMKPTFRVQSLQALWDEELAREGSLFAKRKFEKGAYDMANLYEPFDRFFAPLILNQAMCNIAHDLLNTCGTKLELSDLVNNVKGLPVETAHTHLTLLHETGVLMTCHWGAQVNQLLWALKDRTYDKARTHLLRETRLWNALKDKPEGKTLVSQICSSLQKPSK